MSLLLFLADERTQNRDVTIAIATTVSATIVVVTVIVCLGYVYYTHKVKEIRKKTTMRKIIDNKNRNDMTDIPEKLTTLDDYFRKYETDVTHVFATLESEETENLHRTEASKGYEIVNVLDVMFTAASERKRAKDMLKVPEKVNRIYVDGDMNEYESNVAATFSDFGENSQETSFENESDFEQSLFGDHISIETENQTISDFSDQTPRGFKNHVHSFFDDQTPLEFESQFHSDFGDEINSDLENQIHSDFGDETNAEFENQIHSADFGDETNTKLANQIHTNFYDGMQESFDNQEQTECGDQMQAYKVLYKIKPDFQTLEKKEQTFSDETKSEACKKQNRTKHRKNRLSTPTTKNSKTENSLVSKELKVYRRKQTKRLKKTIRENCDKCRLQNVSSVKIKNRGNFMAAHSASDLQESYIVLVKEKRSPKLKQKTAASSRTSTATSKSNRRHRTLSRASNRSQPLETFVSVSEIGFNI